MLKYSLQTLLFVAICVGGFIAAYRAGQERGYKDGDSRWSAQWEPRSYAVDDLAGADGLYATKDIKNILTVGIHPTSWDTVGGPGTIEVVVEPNGNTVFAITQHPGAHDAIERIFGELRGDH